MSLVLLLMLPSGETALAQGDESKTAAPSTGALSGTVVDDHGQPVPNAAIYVTSPGGLPQPRVAFADNAGNFQLGGLDARVYSVRASAPSYVSPPREPDSLPSYYRIGDSVTIGMLKGGVITGTVVDAAGEPLVQTGVRAILIRDANGKPPIGPRFSAERSTDDRGVYRLYGLLPGTYLVSAGGRAAGGYLSNPYDSDSPTYAPSSTRDTAAEIVVKSGEENLGVDIRYRGIPGRVVSGTVSGPIGPNPVSSININLTQLVNGLPQASSYTFQSPYSKGFAFQGVVDGDYDLTAQNYSALGEALVSEPRRITVKGANVTGIELVLKALASISGQLKLESSGAAECKNKKQPLLSETLVVARRNDKGTPKEQLAWQNTFSQSAPDKTGNFVLRNLSPGQYILNAQFFAKYWYLRSVMRETPGAQFATRKVAANRPIDASRQGINLKVGERSSEVTITLAEGAASLRGAVTAPAGESVPSNLHLQLVPVEKESAEDVLRFFTVPVNSDGTFAVNNLAPGRYWVLAQVVADGGAKSNLRLRAPEEAMLRTQIRRAAESAKSVVEFKPCQNVMNYQLPLAISSVKN